MSDPNVHRPPPDVASHVAFNSFRVPAPELVHQRLALVVVDL